jgi:hypothetical protein
MGSLLVGRWNGSIIDPSQIVFETFSNLSYLFIYIESGSTFEKEI